MPEGSSSCRSRAQTTVRSRNSTKPASVSAAAATPALRGIDLRGHHHTWPGPGNRRRRLRDCPCAMSSNEKHEKPGQARHNRGRRISAARTLARDLPPAAPGRPRPRSSPCSDPTPSSGPPTPPNYPGDQAIELLAWMVPAHIATTPPAGNTPDDASPDGPLPHGGPHPWLRPPEPLIQAARGAQARPPRGSQQGSARHRRRRLKDVTVPHKSSATSSNRYINGRSAYSSGTDDQAPGPVNIRR